MNKLSCFDTKSVNVQKWFNTVGKEMTYKQFLIHNYFLPDFDEYSAVNKDILPITKIREVVKEILSNEEFGFKPIDLLDIADSRAEGAFYKDVLYFAEKANVYTAYEEAFHAIYQRLIPTVLKEDVQKAGKALLEKRLKKEGISLKDYLSKYPSLDYGIEEEIAKEFINYKLYNSSGFLDRKQNIAKLSFLGKLAEPIVKFFEWLSSFFNNVQKNKQKLQSLFDLINSGAFSSSVKMGNTQYEFPSYRIITLSDNRTLNQKEQANVYSGIKSIYKEIKSTDINADIELAIELYKEQVTQDDIIKGILTKEITNRLTKKSTLNNQYKDVFEDIKKQVESSAILTEEEDEEGEDAIQAQINGSSDKDSEKSAIERLSKYTRDYISNIGGIVKIINYNNKPIFVKSYIEINNVYSSIVRNLANTPDFYTKLKKLVQLSDDKKSKDTKVFVDQFLQDLFLDSYEGYSVEEYNAKREAALTELKTKIKSKSGFSFGHSKNGVLIDTDFFEETNTIYLSPKAANKANQILKSFDLYTADVVQQLIDYENGNVISYDPHKASIVLPQLDEWRNNYTNVQYSKIESTNLKSKTVESFKKDFLDKLGIDISDGYVKFLLGKNLNEQEDYIDFASEFDNIPEDTILDREDVDTILRFHNDGKDLYATNKEEEDESVVTRFKKIARGNAYFDESVLESTYQDAEGKYIYAHQNKTFNLNLANVIKSGETWSTDSLNEIKDERVKAIVKNFHEKTPIQKTINKGISFDKLGRFRYTGFRQEDRDDKGNKVEKDNQTNVSFKGITAKDFDAAKLNLAVSQTKWIKYTEYEKDKEDKKNGRERNSLIIPQFVGHFETANTAEFQYMEFIRSIDDNGNLTADAENQFVEYIQSEYDRFQDYVSRLIESNLLDLEDGDKSIKITTKILLDSGWKSAIDGYHTGTIDYSVANGIIEFNKGNLPRALQLSTELNAFSSLFSTTYNTDKENPSKLYENLQDFKREVNKVYLVNLEKQVKELNQPGFENKLSKLFTGNYTSLTKPEQAIVHVLGFSKNLHYNLKQYITNYELNAIGYNRFVYGDMLVFNKNDMFDLFKRNKGSNAAIVSAYSEFLNLDLGIDKIFKEIKTITHDEVEGTSSTDGKSIDSMDAQALASIQHTRHLLYGLGRLTPVEARLLTKMHNGEEFSQEDKKWMFANDTFLSANKTVSYTELQFVKMSEAYTGTLSKRNTSTPIEINITEQQYLSLVNITKDGRIYPKVDSNVEVTKIDDKYFRWEATKDRKGLHAKRLMLEGWRKEKGEWIYKGRDYEAGLIFPKSASKRMVQNSVGLIDNEPDFDSFTENNLNTLSAGQYGLQVENQGIKDKITDPSQNIEIITNELGEIIITNYITGEQSKPISAKDFTETFQNLLAKRDKTSFGQAYKELVNKDGGAIYKYLFELIKAGVDETSSDPQLQQLIQVDAKGNYVYNLNIPLFQQKFQQYLFAYMTKGVLAQKRAGDALVMTSPHGHNLLKKLVVIKDKKGKVIDYSWRVVQRHTQEYRDNVNQAKEGIQEGDKFKSIVNSQFKTKNEGEWKELIGKLYAESKEEFYFIDEVRHAVPEYNKDGKVIGKFSESLMGKWDEKHKDIQKSFMYMFGVRIPSQDKQSSLNIKLVDWLEDGAGNAIVVPKEYQQLSGADYDVDKIYTYKQEGYWDGDRFIQYTSSKNEAENYLQWRKYYFKDNKTAKKLKRSLLDENSYYTDLKRDYQSFISYKNQVLANLDLPQEESDIIESIEAQQEFIQEVSKDKRKKEYKFINTYQEQLRELENKLSDINSVKEYLQRKKQFNEKLYDLKNELLSIEFNTESQVLEELQLPSTISEFKDSEVTNNAVLNNELLAMFQSAISSDKMTEKISVKNVSIEESPYTKEGYELYQEKVNKGIHETGTSVDWLKKADKYYKSLEGINFNSDNKEFGIRSIRTDYKYFKGSQGGKKGIGSAVNNMLASLTWKKVNNYNLGINLNQEDLLGISKYQDTTEDGLERTSDNNSTQTTATTDEAKEQALAKYNIRGKALDVFATALALGYRIDQAILLVNVPLVQEYLDDRSLGKFGDGFIPLLYTEKDLANVIKGSYVNRKIESAGEETYEVKLKDIEESALFDFIQIEKQAEINSNLMQFVKLKRGYKPEYSAFETIIEAGNKLGFGNLPELESVYGKNEKPLFNFAQILQDNKESLKQLYQNVTEIVPKTKEVTEKFLLVANPEYKGLVNSLNANTKFGVDKLKLGKEVQTWLISNYLNNPINTDILFGENSLAKQLQRTDVTDNALVNHLNSLIDKDGFDQIAIKAFSRLKADKQESLIDGFNILMIDPKTQPLALAIYNYFGIKDGFLYKPNSISKVLPVHMFKEMSDSVDKFLQDSLSLQDRDKVIEEILTDISNKNLLVNAKEGKIYGEQLIPSTFSIEGKEIPITVANQYTNKKGETKENKIIVEYIVDSEKVLPNFIKVFNNLYKKYPISETEVRYILIPFFGNPKFKIQTTKEKTIAPQDYKLAQSLVQSFKNEKGETKEGRYVTLAKKDSTYKDLIKVYSQALNRTQIVEDNYPTETESEEVDYVDDEEVEYKDIKETKVKFNTTLKDFIEEYGDLNFKTISNEEIVKLNEKLKNSKSKFEIIGEKVFRGDYVRSEITDYEMFLAPFVTTNSETNQPVYTEYIPTIKFTYLQDGKEFKGTYSLANQDYRFEKSFYDTYKEIEKDFYTTVPNLKSNLTNEDKLNVSEIYSKLGNKTQSGNVILPKDLGLTYEGTYKSNMWTVIYPNFKKQYPKGIVAYRGKVDSFAIGNPFSVIDKGENTVKQFIEWITTGNNFGVETILMGGKNYKLSDLRNEYINIIKKSKGEKILYYTELNRPSHATALDFLINNWEKINNSTNEQQVKTPIVESKGIEINSYQTGLGNSLTNVHYAKNGKSEFDIIPSDKSLKLTQEAKTKWGESVEAWYKSNNAQTKGISEGEQGDKYDMDLMIGLITDKFTQYPNLVEQINQNGGLEFLQKSTHNMGSGRWSSKNPKNMFIKSLIQSYKNVKISPTPIVEEKDSYQYYGAIYTIILENNVGIDVKDYKGKNIDKQKLLNFYNTNPNVDPQNGRLFRTPTIVSKVAEKSIIKKYELFPDVYANEQQTVAIDKAKEFLKSADDEFLLKGRGGCLGYGTKILMYDGSFKEVQDILVGDKLMGIDSTPRNVEELKRGNEQMYWVHQNKGMSYRVNENHILSLKLVYPKQFGRKTENGKRIVDKSYRRSETSVETKNIVLNDYINLSDTSRFKKHLKGYVSNAIEFGYKKINIDPYYYGLWLGDGHTGNIRTITNTDEQIIKYLNDTFGIRRVDGGITYTIENAEYLEYFKSLYNISNGAKLKEKYIHSDYLLNNKEIRLQVLAGIIDSDGYFSQKSKSYEVTFKSKQLAENLSFLTRSLGFRTKLQLRFAKCNNCKEDIYPVYRVTFSPEYYIPTKIDYKTYYLDKSNFKNRLHTGLKIEKDIVDNYYGFSLDGDNLFILEDFTVTHNTGKTTSISKALENVRKEDVIGATVSDEARQVLQSNMEGYKTTTIAGLLGLVPDYDNQTGIIYFRERNEQEELEFRSKFKVDPIEKAKVIIVDEASMISENLYEKILKLKRKDAKVIFMGDNAQIPPINEKDQESKDSPVFKLIGTKNYAELTQRMRQAEESPILPITDLYAENIENIQNNKPSILNPLVERVNNFKNNEGVLFLKNKEQLISDFIVDLQKNQDTKNTVIIGARNEVIDNLNNEIRENLFGNTDAFNIGDRIRVNSPHVVDNQVELPNGFKGIVEKISKLDRKVGELDLFELTVKYAEINQKGKTETLYKAIVTIDPKFKNKFKPELNKLALVAKKLPYKSDEQKRAWREFYNLKEQVVDIGYGYAITTHKVQGSTYNSVFVLEADIMNFPGGREQVNRMMYTATSRPRTKLVIYNPSQEIKESPQEVAGCTKTI